LHYKTGRGAAAAAAAAHERHGMMADRLVGFFPSIFMTYRHFFSSSVVIKRISLSTTTTTTTHLI
jgi:hypothetical protein